jgi:hypothetical protein
MQGWTCPECGRLFARSRQGHECSPGLSLDDYFATGPPFERAVFDAVMAHARALGQVHADVVSVGIFLKNPQKFAELRPMTRWVAVSFPLIRTARHPRITRKVVEYSGRQWHTANVASAEEVDDGLCSLIAEAYALVSERS